MTGLQGTQTTSKMDPDAAIAYVLQRFPFQNYMDESVDSYKNIAATAQRYLKPGDRILDFGAGPCDKTAVLQSMGFRCAAFDDLLDDWHSEGDNRERILRFAAECGIDFRLASDGYLPFHQESFEMVMLHDVLEHLHDSPRELLNDLIALIRPDGYLFVTVPNAVNIRKRVAVVLGRTNLPPFDTYYWYPGPWRGHVREYVRDDLVKLSEYSGLERVELHSCHHMLKVLPPIVRAPYVLLSNVFPSWRDSWLLVARRPRGWTARNELPKDEYETMMRRVSPYYR
jgi:SAM-dependent methyltransferase